MEGGEYQYARVKRWTKRRKLDVFSFDQILVPVNIANIHWALAVLDLTEKKLIYYDSLGQTSETVLENLAKWLTDESLSQHKHEQEISSWKRCFPVNIPLQNNSSDCGMFLCMYAEHIVSGRDFQFSSRDVAYSRKRLALDICFSS